MPSEFVRDTPQPWYIQYLPFIVFVIIVVIQIIYGLACLLSVRHGEEYANRSAMAVGIIIALVILALLLYIIFMLCRDGWNLSAWFFVIVILICSLSMNVVRSAGMRQHEEVVLNVQ